MRGLAGFLLFTALAVGLVVVVVVPWFIKPMAEQAVRDASPFGDQALEVEATVDALDVLRGVVGEIRISGEGLTKGDVAITTLDIDVRSVGFADHEFASISGGLNGVRIALADGTPLTIESVALSGASREVTALAHLDRAATIAFVAWCFNDAGLVVDEIGLEDGGVSVKLFDQTVTLAVGAQDGALVIPDVLGAGLFQLVVPQPEDPWRITGASVTSTGMDIQASVDVGRLLEGGAPAS